MSPSLVWCGVLCCGLVWAGARSSGSANNATGRSGFWEAGQYEGCWDGRDSHEGLNSRAGRDWLCEPTSVVAWCVVAWCGLVRAVTSLTA